MTVDLAAQVLGEGPPLVVLHGLFGSGRNWSGLARKLAERRRVHLLDLRNHGDSPWHDEVGYAAMATDVEAYLDSHGLEQVEVIGHSMGGKTAMTLALARPEQVATLLVVDIAPVAYGHSHEGFAEAMQALDLAAVTRRGDADQALAAAVPDPGIRAFLLQNLVARDGGYAWRLNLAALQAGMAALIGFPPPAPGARYDGPTLFLGGGLSDYIGPEHHAAIDAHFPRAEVDHLPDAGHWVHAEQPAAFLERAQAFLDSTSGD